MAVRVVTDTTAYLPAALAAAHGIEQVSLAINWGDESIREADMPDFDEFYERLRSAEPLPTTSQPSIGEFFAVYEPLLEAGHSIVSIHISGGISGTYETALQAKAALERGPYGADRVRVIDSKTTGAGLGLIALGAAAKAAGGDGIDEVEERALAVRRDQALWFAVDTLEYLKRGGRIGAAAAWIGSTMKIKPILTIDGEIRPIERVRTHARAIDRIVEYATRKLEPEDAVIAVQHIQALPLAERVAARCAEIVGDEPILISEIGPVIGTHIGPGLIGVAVAPKGLVR